MTSPLDILVIESHPGAAVDAALDLEAAGHHVARCHDAGSRGFPCRGVLDPADCPVTIGTAITLLVRREAEPRPTPLGRA